MKTYGRADAEAIIGQHFTHIYEIRDDGVWPTKIDGEWSLPWSPAVDLEGPDAPNPLETPNLPIPFTANQLAAFMLDGVGAGVASLYGTWAKGPMEDMLATLDPRAKGAREALVAAYAACRAAEAEVGRLDHKGLENLSTAESEAAYSPWRKAMVHHLLKLPILTTSSYDGVKWTSAMLAELSDFRVANTMAETAKKFGISEQRIRQLLPSNKTKTKTKTKGYSVFTHITK